MRKHASFLAVVGLTTASSLFATLQTQKVTLNDNMTLHYNVLPKSVTSLSDIFKEGIFYGRLRMNTFYWKWDEESSGVKENNKAMGVGGSVVFKSASYKGVSATAALYTSQNPSFFRMDADEVALVRSGKDTFSRYYVARTGQFGMTVLGQAYMQYANEEMQIRIGRQLVETVFTKSNDTKMIPNTFDGVTLSSTALPKTKMQFAYLTRQKLRDHIHSHDVIAVSLPTSSDPYASWKGNDDSGKNVNLTTQRVGNDNKLIIASITSKQLENTSINFSYAAVPSILNDYLAEVHYALPVGGWKIIPGVRYLLQKDALHADYVVASLKSSTAIGYKDPYSLDSSLLCARVDFKKGGFLGRLGYSKVADKAGIVNTWRGFPTGGYTRVMGQYNWYANTVTYMVRAGYAFDNAGTFKGLSIMGRYAWQDFDDAKDAVPADSGAFNVDIRQNLGNDAQLKLRFARVNAKDNIKKSDGSLKSDYSYSEYRVELNYFF